jgi:hypothetical protein
MERLEISNRFTVTDVSIAEAKRVGKTEHENKIVESDLERFTGAVHAQT